MRRRSHSSVPMVGLSTSLSSPVLPTAKKGSFTTKFLRTRTKISTAIWLTAVEDTKAESNSFGYSKDTCSRLFSYLRTVVDYSVGFGPYKPRPVHSGGVFGRADPATHNTTLIGTLAILATQNRASAHRLLALPKSGLFRTKLQPIVLKADKTKQ